MVQKVWARQSDIAREADVSLATVDRVLNDRPGVSVRTANRIWEAVHRLQSETPPPLNNQRNALTFDVILPAGPNSFLNMLADEVTQQAQAHLEDNITVRCHRVEGFAPKILADCIIKVGSDSDGVAVMALENPLVREAVTTLSEKNIPVVSLVSNLSTPNTIGYVGLNNRAAGRTAAYLLNLIAHQKFGDIALFEGSIDLAYSDHQEREFGFKDAIREYAPDFNILGKWATQDNHEEAYRKTREVMETNPNILGIYCIGGGVRGIARALQDCGKEKDVICIGHDLTNHTREFLLNGTLDAVINQNPADEAREAIKMLIEYVRKGKVAKSQVHISTDVFFRENLP